MWLPVRPCSSVQVGVLHPSHLGNVALSFLPQPLVLNLLHVGITWEALNTTDDRVGVSPEILM